MDFRYGLDSYGICSHGPYSYGLHGNGLYSYGVYSYGMYTSHGLCHRTMSKNIILQASKGVMAMDFLALEAP